MIILYTMKLIQIKELIKERKNLIFYNKDVYPCYKELKDEYICVFFDEPVPTRAKLITILTNINPDFKFNKHNITIAELKEDITKVLDKKNLIILFNNFEKLNKTALEAFTYLNSSKNIQFICSFKNNFKKLNYYFYQKFVFVNKKDYNPPKKKNQINITYTIYAIISVYCFLIYTKTSFSLNTATILIGAVWFSLIIYRTLMYAGGRV